MLARAAALLLLFLLPIPARAAGYVVQPGDTMTSIAQRYHVSVNALARTNGIQNVNMVPIGRVLSIPIPMHRLYYRVQWGDTLTGIALHYGISIGTIRGLNPSLGAFPIAGQLLHLCSPCGGTSYASGSTTSTATTVTGASNATYTVQPGDTLSEIAATYSTTENALMSTNGLVNPNLVVIGSHLSLPGGSAAPATAAAPATSVSSGYNPALTRQLLISYAYSFGVSPALALAISWQESGFNQTLTSRTGAIGAMQVEPYTGDHISWLLGRNFNLYNLDDNVHAGVYWISTLLRYYGGDERSAVAAYYQGTRSIAQRGWYEDTKQYVANVMSLKASFGG